MHEKNGLNDNKEQLSREFKLLESLEGFSKLSERQQRLIRLSLYVQQRAVRFKEGTRMSPNTKRFLGVEIEEVKRLHEEDSKLISNRLSREQVANWYCHLSAYVLETENIDVSGLKLIPDDFFDAEYFDVSQYDEVESRVLDVGFPCVVHIGNPDIDYYANVEDRMVHTCVALGKDDQGQIIVWEKMNYGLPYRTTTLSDVFNSYTKLKTVRYKWGIRPLNLK